MQNQHTRNCRNAKMFEWLVTMYSHRHEEVTSSKTRRGRVTRSRPLTAQREIFGSAPAITNDKKISIRSRFRTQFHHITHQPSRCRRAWRRHARRLPRRRAISMPFMRTPEVQSNSALVLRLVMLLTTARQSKIAPSRNERCKTAKSWDCPQKAWPASEYIALNFMRDSRNANRSSSRSYCVLPRSYSQERWTSTHT